MGTNGDQGTGASLEKKVLRGQVVVLGFDAALGFAPADSTSPALAARAGALPDVAMDPLQATELRVHGVSGSTGETMLEHPHVLQVAGDLTTGFYRRWSPDGGGKPSVPWKLEAYSWGGLTQAPLKSASWLLLAPLMMYNLAYFMLPPDPASEVIRGKQAEHLRRGGGFQLAHILLRLLALAATVQLASAAAAALMSTVAWQAAGRPGALPAWMGWYDSLTTGGRIDFALAAVVLIIAALWWLSVTTATKYEARTSAARLELNGTWPLTQPGFWKGAELNRRQRGLHAAAACAAVALIAALPPGHPAAVHWAATILAGAVLAAAAISVATPMADRHTVTLTQGGEAPAGGVDRVKRWRHFLLGAAAVALLAAAAASAWTQRSHGPQSGGLPGLTGFLAVLAGVQAALLVIFAATVVLLAGRARAASPDPAPTQPDAGPYLGGNLATLVTALGVLLGGMLSAVACTAVTRLLGTPVPSGFRFDPPSPDAIDVPWPLYAFGAVPVGLLLGAIPAAILLARRYSGRRRGFLTAADAASSQVAQAYATAIATGDPAATGEAARDGESYAGQRGVIAGAWALGRIVDYAGPAAAWVIGGGFLAVLAAEVAAAVGGGPPGSPARLDGWLHGVASVITFIVLAVAGLLVTLLRQAYSDPARRKGFSTFWDVATFWPRAVHPLAPPCYAERAVPELTDRIRLLTGHLTGEPGDAAALHAQASWPNLPGKELTIPSGPVLLTGYSQGSVIAPAVIAQLDDDTLREVALLTLACPARRLYGRAFPAFFGGTQLATLRRILDAEPGKAGGRWKNLWRRSDFIGSWVFTEPCPGADSSATEVDESCLDPVILVQDANPTPPPIHRHSQWWQDPRTSELGGHLIRVLACHPGGPGARDSTQRYDADPADTPSTGP